MRDNVVVLVRLPDVPVIVTVTVPVVAVLLAERVIVLVLAALLGLNDAVTPLGSPEADNATLPLKPFCPLTVIVLVPLAPCVMVKLLGEVESVKFGGGFTVSEIVVALDRLLEEPVIVTVTVPVVAVLLAVSVNVLVLAALVPAVLLGLKDAATPAGKPEADKLTLPLKPLCEVIVMVLVPLAP